jgi:hypothetical protein
MSIKCASNILVGISAAALLVGLPVLPASADFISSTLGAAAGFAVLEIGTGNISMANASNAGFVTGNIGVNGGNFGDSGVPITGNVITGLAATLNPNVAGNVTGTITTNQALLTAAVNAANNASATFSALAPTLSNTSINGTTTINLAAGVNGHHTDYRHPSRNIRNHKSIPQWDKKTPSQPRCIDLRREPVPPHRMGFPGKMILRWGCHWEPHGRPAIEFPW